MDLPRAAATFFAVSSLGCASLRAPLTPPSRGGAAWTEVSSAHFVLRTDADADDARAMTAQLEEAGRELDAALAARPDEPRYLLGRVAWHERHKQGVASTVPTELLDHLVRTATSASQLRGAAYHLRLQGRVEEGFQLIDRALVADPLCWSCQETRALLLADAGKLDLAVAAMDRVMVLLPEKAPVAEVVALRRKMEVARSAAASAPPPPR